MPLQAHRPSLPPPLLTPHSLLPAYSLLTAAAYLLTYSCLLPPPAQDQLALHAINFLTAVARSVHFTLFQDATALRQICQSIVIPNIKMREDMVGGWGAAGRWMGAG